LDNGSHHSIAESNTSAAHCITNDVYAQALCNSPNRTETHWHYQVLSQTGEQMKFKMLFAIIGVIFVTKEADRV